MPTNLSITKRLGLGFGTLLLLLVLAISFALFQARQARALLAGVRADQQALSLGATLEREMILTGRYIRSYALEETAAGRSTQKDKLAKSKATYDEVEQRLVALLGTEGPESLAILRATDPERAKATTIHEHFVELVDQDKKGEAVQLIFGDGRKAISAWEQGLDRLMALQEKQAGEKTGEAAKASNRANAILLGIGAGALALGIGLSLAIARSIAGPAQAMCRAIEQGLGRGDLTADLPVCYDDELGRVGRAFNGFLAKLRLVWGEMAEASLRTASGSTELSSSAEEMSATTDQIARSTETQRCGSDRLSAAVTQLSVSIRQVAGNVKAARGQAESASRVADDGQGTGNRTTEAMLEIRETTEQIVRAVQVIQEIARQTNLLSLNAAIEAAKAGAQGKGFAVVAEEVRKLAERSSQSAKEIAELIINSNRAVDDGQSAVAATTSALEAIKGNVSGLSGLVLEIGSATGEQTHTSEEVARAVVDGAAQATQNAAAVTQLAATVHEVARTAGDLAQVAERLAEAVSQFKV